MYKQPTKPLFTNEEVFKISDHGIIQNVVMAINVYNAACEYLEKKDLDGYTCHLYSLHDVFEAGRLQGIREERQRRSRGRKSE